MNEFSEREQDRLCKAARLLTDAEKPLATIRLTSWPSSIAETFFATGQKELPRVGYSPLNAEPCLEIIAEARSLIHGDSPVHNWLKRLADIFDQTAKLLSALGTVEFYTYSASLFGVPETLFSDGTRTTIDFARRLDTLLTDFEDEDLAGGPRQTFTAEVLKSEFDTNLDQMFGLDAPVVEIVDHLSAKAVAGQGYIRLNSNVTFSDLDSIQLLQHEAYVHIATGLNGAAQPFFPILGEAHPGNTRTQEGLAVFAEFISGALGPHRLKRLAGRVIGIQMAIDGADFLDLYRFFLGRGEQPRDAFEMARRVVRGGLVTGGAPFTKDVVYLGGMLDVHSYLRTAVRHADTSLIKLLFSGKFELDDLEAMLQLRQAGLLADPRYLPPWAQDMRGLVSYLAYSVFLNEINLTNVQQRYEFLFDHAVPGNTNSASDPLTPSK